MNLKVSVDWCKVVALLVSGVVAFTHVDWVGGGATADADGNLPTDSGVGTVAANAGNSVLKAAE